MKDCPVQHFVSWRTFLSCTTFNLKEYISVNITITVIFNLNIFNLTILMYITGFQKLVTVSIGVFNNLLLNKSHGMLQ